MIFGETLKELRTDRGLSQQQLADELKISQSAIAKWELSKTEPVASMIVKLAKYFDVDSDFLLGLRDENGNPLTRRDRNGKEVAVCTSAKQENVKRFIKENPQFRDMFLKMPGIDKNYIDALIQKMSRDGLTDMTKELERHPEWINQPAIDVHHVINIKDCRLFEEQGKSYTAVNDYDNMCIVSNGTLADALNRARGMGDKNDANDSVHASIHKGDMVFKDRGQDGDVRRTMVRIEPEPGVRCMLGFDEEMMMQIAVLENLQREDLNPLEEAEAYDMLMKNLKLTQAQVAERLGKSRPYIANYLRLLSLPKLVKEMVQEERLSMGQARTLLGLKDKSNLLKLANRCVKENLTVRQLEKLVSEMNEAKEKKKIPRLMKEKPYYLRESEERLMDKFGTSVAIQEKNGKGKIEIEYLSQNDLTRILDILDIHFDS